MGGENNVHIYTSLSEDFFHTRVGSVARESDMCTLMICCIRREKGAS